MRNRLIIFVGTFHAISHNNRGSPNAVKSHLESSLVQVVDTEMIIGCHPVTLLVTALLKLQAEEKMSPLFIFNKVNFERSIQWIERVVIHTKNIQCFAIR